MFLADRGDAAGLIDEPVPGVGAGIDEGTDVREDGRRQVVFLEVLPDAFDRVEFQRIGGLEHQGEVGWHGKGVRGVTSGTVEDHDAVSVLGDLGRQLGQEPGHHPCVEPVHDESDLGVAGRADRTDYPGRTEALVAVHPGPLAALPPETADAPLLSDPALVLEYSSRRLSGWRTLTSHSAAAPPF